MKRVIAMKDPVDVAYDKWDNDNYRFESTHQLENYSAKIELIYAEVWQADEDSDLVEVITHNYDNWSSELKTRFGKVVDDNLNLPLDDIAELQYNADELVLNHVEKHKKSYIHGEGQYSIKCVVELVYDISGVIVDNDGNADTSDAISSYNQAKSSLSSFNVVRMN